MTVVNPRSAERVTTTEGVSLSATTKHVGPLLNSAEVAQMIRVPESTLRYWRHIGIGPRSFKMGPRRVLYRADDVLAWVADQYASER
jgi:predicted DNA-binding transcriptional regulator AlpA